MATGGPEEARRPRRETACAAPRQELNRKRPGAHGAKRVGVHPPPTMHNPTGPSCAQGPGRLPQRGAAVQHRALVCRCAPKTLSAEYPSA